jgi:hypothetical protein
MNGAEGRSAPHQFIHIGYARDRILWRDGFNQSLALPSAQQRREDDELPGSRMLRAVPKLVLKAPPPEQHRAANPSALDREAT